MKKSREREEKKRNTLKGKNGTFPKREWKIPKTKSIVGEIRKTSSIVDADINEGHKTEESKEILLTLSDSDLTGITAFRYLNYIYCHKDVLFAAAVASSAFPELFPTVPVTHKGGDWLI